MKRNSGPVLLEIVIMLLFFSVSVAVCMRIFAVSCSISERKTDIDRAVILAQNVAEALKAANGDTESAAAVTGGIPGANNLKIYCGSDWEPAGPDNAEFVIEAELYHVNYLASARVSVTAASGEELFSLRTGWQEVAG